MFRKRKNPSPSFRMPPPFQPISGQQAALRASGLWPYCVLMQVAKEDVHKNYCVCRGFDPRIGKFIDYEDGNADKPGIPVAKPYGSRRTGLYEIAQIFAAALPIQSSDSSADPSAVYRVPPSPTTAPIRLGQNPGKASDGHPDDLDETVNLLLTDDGKHINWMFLEAPAPVGTVARAKLAADMRPDDCCVAVECVRGACSETVTEARNYGWVGEAGDTVYLAKIADCGAASGDDCDTDCDNQSGVTCSWEVISVQPRALCPVTKVEDRTTCLVEEHSKFYGWWDPDRTSHAEKIADITECETSGSPEECDLSSGWRDGCAGS